MSVALAGIGVMAIVGVAAAGTLRRHLRLARLKTDLVAAVSHELRTPLASMRVLVDGLLADEPLDPKKTREYLDLLAIENARLSRLIENFLTFSRLERNRQRFVFAPVQPSAIVAARSRRHSRSRAGGLRSPGRGRAGLPPVMADAEALRHGAHQPAGQRAQVHAGRQAHRRSRVATDGDGSVMFAVEDNGIGIPSREQRRIFRRFYRVDQRLARETSGVGLGLSIVELIVRGHGGTVSVRSAPGAGSTFTLRCRRGRPASGGTAA